MEKNEFFPQDVEKKLQGYALDDLADAVPYWLDYLPQRMNIFTPSPS